MSTKKTDRNNKSIQSVIAKSDDGTIQITYTIPYEDIQKAQLEVASEVGKDIEVPGFRKGKAPVDKVIAALPQNSLLEKTLTKILPKLFAETVEKEKIKPAIYPKFELIKASADKDWQIRAITCEIPKIELGDYKKQILGSLRAKSIWTPSSPKSSDNKKGHTLTREEKEQEVIKTLLETVKLTIPKILIEEEVNTRLSKLLERIEKLGLSLESYLSSINKTAQKLREEYENQARDALKLDLILTEIANSENVKVDEAEINKAINAASADRTLQNELDTPERRTFIEAILKRRKALDSLVSLI